MAATRRLGPQHAPDYNEWSSKSADGSMAERLLETVTGQKKKQPVLDFGRPPHGSLLRNMGDAMRLFGRIELFPIIQRRRGASAENQKGE
jgi:hypothetical protein